MVVVVNLVIRFRYNYIIVCNTCAERFCAIELDTRFIYKFLDLLQTVVSRVKYFAYVFLFIVIFTVTTEEI